MQDRHTNRKRYFREQAESTRKFVLPYIQRTFPVTGRTRVFEIGCGEGGNLVPFLELGCEVVGVDLLPSKIELAKAYIAEDHPEARVELLLQDIYDASADRLGDFDLVILRDVIEHIHDQERFLRFVHKFVRPGGRIFFGFPPWRMPFGGHQQICRSKLLSKLPWFHLLPVPLYKGLLTSFGEEQGTVAELLEIKETGISIRRFTETAKRAGWAFEQQDLWFINPNYETKFGLTPRRLAAPLRSLPWVKDFMATCCYALVKKA